MEFPVFLVLAGLSAFFYWAYHQLSDTRRMAVLAIFFVACFITGIIVMSEGFTYSNGFAPLASTNICSAVQNCTNAQNSTCSISNSCAYTYSNSGLFTVTKKDVYTDSLGILIFIFAIFKLLTDGYEALKGL